MTNNIFIIYLRVKQTLKFSKTWRKNIHIFKLLYYFSGKVHIFCQGYKLLFFILTIMEFNSKMISQLLITMVTIILIIIFCLYWEIIFA